MSFLMAKKGRSGIKLHSEGLGPNVYGGLLLLPPVNKSHPWTQAAIINYRSMLSSWITAPPLESGGDIRLGKWYGGAILGRVQ